MKRNPVAPLLLLSLLGGCSYSYDLVAVVRQGRIFIEVPQYSKSHPTCLRRVEVYADGERQPDWRESTSYDDACANKFPLPYRVRLKGQHQSNGSEEVAAKPIRRETVYEVSTTTGATEYGMGRFVVHADGRVENLPTTSFLVDSENGS